MVHFFLNDCFPQDESKHKILLYLENTLKEYRDLKVKCKHDIDGIVTSQSPSNICLNNSPYTLTQCIGDLPNRDLKNYAFALFRKYPIKNHFDIKNEDNLIENDFFIYIGDQQYNALNLKIVQDDGGFLFSLALHEDLCRNEIPIISNTTDKFIVPNLFGNKDNTLFIGRKINDVIFSQAGNPEKLKLSIGNCFCSKNFENSFNNISRQVQDSIIQHFIKAKERNGITCFFADQDLIKDVTPEKEIEIRVFELRIFNPVAYRVYFYESADAVYLGLMERKSSDKIQSNHIKTAVSIIKSMVLIK